MASGIDAYLNLLSRTELAEWASARSGSDDVRSLVRGLFEIPFRTEGLPLRQGRPTHPDVVEAVGEAGLRLLFPNWPRPRILSLAAGTLQVFDFWDPSHEAAQTAEDLGERVFAPYWHGIAHRREPDAGNAAYWYRRVGTASIHADLAAEAASDPDPETREIAGRLVRNGRWDPFAMIDLCGRARAESAEERTALKYQEREIALLADSALGAFGA